MSTLLDFIGEEQPGPNKDASGEEMTYEEYMAKKRAEQIHGHVPQMLGSGSDRSMMPDRGKSEPAAVTGEGFEENDDGSETILSKFIHENNRDGKLDDLNDTDPIDNSLSNSMGGSEPDDTWNHDGPDYPPEH